jgi:hypothetical protein
MNRTRNHLILDYTPALGGNTGARAVHQSEEWFFALPLAAPRSAQISPDK